MAGDILNQLIERSAIGVAALAPDDRLVYSNGRLAAILGYSSATIAAMPLSALVHPGDFWEVETALASVRDGTVPSSRFDARFVSADGNPRWVEVTAATLAGGDFPPRTVVLLARDVSARRESDRGLRVQHLVSRSLAGADSFEQAIRQVLADIGLRLRWELGAYWELAPNADVLVPFCTWRSPSHTPSAFEKSTLALRFHRGEGVPGTVWETNAPQWESDAQARSSFPRFAAANAEGLHAVFAFPVRTASRLYGVIEFFSQDVLPPDSTLLDASEGIGYQIGQFLERERAQAESHVSDVRNASVLETALDCIITIDGGGCITEFNPAAERTFGYRKDDVIGREMSDLIVPPSLREAHRAGMRRFLATGQAHVIGRRIEITGMRSDQSEFPVELAIVKVPLPGPVFFTAYLRDLTERKQLENYQNLLLTASEKLASSLEYEVTVSTVAHLAVPSIADWCAVDLVGGDGKLKRVAVAHVDPMKISAVEAMENKYPADPAALTGAHEAIRSGKTQWASEIPDEVLTASARNADHLKMLRDLGLKSYIIVPLRARLRNLGALTLVNAESGRRFTEAEVKLAEDLAGRMAIAVENALLLLETEEARIRVSEQADKLEESATEMAEAHEELEVINEELAATNEELHRKTDEVVAALAAAEEANRAKSDFLATMSHELRTPLNAIGGYAELISLGIRGPVTDQQKADLGRITRSQNQLLTLINDILRFAKLQSGTLEFQMSEILVDDVLCHSDDLVRPQIDAKRLSYRYEPGDPETTVCADPDRFQQIVLNLLSNAVKFTPEGGSIVVSCKAAPTMVAISIADTGVGIPPEKVARVFDPFVQVHAPAAKTSEGVGLGLAISRDIALRMKGTLTVESEIGKGSVFTLTLPRGKDREPG